jgi:hypothetical protein
MKYDGYSYMRPSEELGSYVKTAPRLLVNNEVKWELKL